jgi:hypothetical protein
MSGHPPPGTVPKANHSRALIAGVHMVFIVDYLANQTALAQASMA